jgi:hypothetical protein
LDCGRPVRGGGRARLAVHLLLLFGQLLEERVLLQLLAHHLLELQRGQLQELDGLLEERGHHDPLGGAERKTHGSGSHGSRQRENFSPR